MKMLGIDYGKKKIGLAVSDGMISEPFRVIRYDSFEKLIKSLKHIVDIQGVQQVVVGISEGIMGKESKEFGEKLEKELKTPVAFQDETLSTHSAQELSIDANIKRKKRREMEDAYSAAIILQSYIDGKL